MFAARFDDARTGRSVRLEQPTRAIVAHELGDVESAIEEASQAARAGSWVGGYVAYDAAPAFDASLIAHRDRGQPLVWFGVFSDAAITPMVDEPLPPEGSYSISRWNPLMSPDTYRTAFSQVRHHLEVGDSYQVNLTFPVQAAFSGSARGLYHDLFSAQEPAYGAHVRHDGRHIVSVSPERFFAIDGRRLTTRPMKGTRPRGRWSADDVAIAAGLAASEKDRAENLMIVDLIRNDLGRIASFGTVEVDELFAIERYPTVWQMTSEVSAELRPDVSLVDVFRALFPCGSVTGAPKARSMEIIADVEQRPRGPYCGAVGFVPPGDGSHGATFSVAIRTAVIDDDEGFATYGVGGGVTWDSNPDGEYDEALAKAAVLATSPHVPSLVETMRWDDGVLWLDEHLDRMEASSEYFGIAMPRADIEAALETLGTLLSLPHRVRIELSPDGGCAIDVRRLAGRFAATPGPTDTTTRVVVDHDPVSPTERRLYHKTGDRTVYETRANRHPEADEVLLTNTAGMVTEGTFTNVAVLEDGQWFTPPLDDGVLPGIMRASLLAAGVLTERSIPVAHLSSVEAIAVFNSVRGWRPAVLLDRVALST